MTDNMLTWNVRNWITVLLMFVFGWAVLTLAGRLALGKLIGSQPAAQSGYPMVA